MNSPVLSEHEALFEVNEHVRLIQRTDGLRFGTDAYLLAALVRARRGARAVDLGSGTGIIPLLCLAREKIASAVAVELQPTFCDLITRNATLNGCADRLRSLCADVRGLTPSMVGGEVDVVTANPPYMPPHSGARNESDEKYIARHETAGTVADFCAAAGRLLKYGGRFYCVFRPERLCDLMIALRTARLEPKRLIAVQATYAAPPSLILVEAIRGGAPGMTLLPPLSLHEPDEREPHKPRLPLADTPEAAYIYGHCAFPGEKNKRE